MTPLKLIGMVPLVLIAATSFAQDDNRAVPRGSGSSSTGAGERHSGGSSSSGSSASSDSGRQGGSSAASSAGSSYSRASDAARRRPRPGTGTGDRGRYGISGGRYYGSPYSFYYYDPYAYSWGYSGPAYGRLGYGYGYYDYGYSYGDYYGYPPWAYSRSYRYRAGNVAQLRTLVEPAKARVYVDGYYAGIADDFDGIFQRLNVSPGRHDITFKLEGYGSHTFSIYANRNQTLKLRFDMVRGNTDTRDSIGEPNDPRADRDRDRGREMELEDDSTRSPETGEVDTDRSARLRGAPTRDAGLGTLTLDVAPGDASVYVDGEFYGKASQVSRVELPAGRHRIEVVRPGYRTEEADVDVDGEPQRVVVKLQRR